MKTGNGSPQSDTSRRDPVARVAGWLLGLNAALIVFSLLGTAARLHGPAPDWDYETIARVMAIANISTASLVSLLLMVRSQGWRSALFLLALCTVIAGGLEYASTVTGFPFGNYHYTDALGPMLLGKVPILIPIAWFMMLYPALQMGHQLRLGPLQLGLASGLLLMVWDLALDPAMTTGFAAWLWEDGGWYYGIPLQNFMAWFVTAAVIAGIHAGLGPAWRRDESALPIMLFLLQCFFAGVLAALYDRSWALIVTADALFLLALAARARLRSLPPADEKVGSGS